MSKDYVLRKGIKRLYEFLKTKTIGDVVEVGTLLEETRWSDSALNTYQSKDMLAPLMMETSPGFWTVLVHGPDLQPNDMRCLSQQRTHFINK